MDEFTRFKGLRIIESVHLDQAGEPYEVRRTWRERLFTHRGCSCSRALRPLQATQWAVRALRRVHREVRPGESYLDG